MQENVYFKPGADFPDYSSDGVPETSALPTERPENTGIVAGMDWMTSGMGPTTHDLQRDAAENTALGSILIPV